RLWKIELDQVPEYLERESLLNKVNKILEPYLDDLNFAGTYINVTNNLVIIYTVNMDKKRDIISNPNISEYKKFLDFRKVDKPLAYLKSSFKDLDRIAQQNKPRGIFTDQNVLDFINIARKYDADVHLPSNTTSTNTKRDRLITMCGNSGGTIFSFSNSSDLSRVTINGIHTAGLQNCKHPSYPFSMALPRDIILNIANLDLIASF
ncbi:4605_t:CDS:2, partial [Racocetra persica]